MKDPKKRNIIRSLISTSLVLSAISLGMSQKITLPLNLPIDSFCNKIEKPLSKSIMFQDFKTYYQKNLGIFCKAENKIASTSKINMKFRLGSIPYVDKLESKLTDRIDY